MVANVVSVTYLETGIRTVSVLCRCREEHDVVWPSGAIESSGQLPCGVSLSNLAIPAWALDPRYRTGYAKLPARAHKVFAADGDLNDNGFDEPELNWIE